MAYDKMTNAEQLVADFLKQNRIRWEFERPVVLLDDADRVRIWSPDYYLPELGVYVEVAASGNSTSYEYRATVYNKNKIPVVFVNPYKQNDWEQWVITCLNSIHQDRWEIIKSIKKSAAKSSGSTVYKKW